jgi:hypothetical protein
MDLKMKFLKRILILILFLMGIFSICKLDFLDRIMLITKVNQFDGCQSSCLQRNYQYLAQDDAKQISRQLNISQGRDGFRNDGRGKHNRRLLQNRNNWRRRFDFQTGMVNVMFYFSILVLFVMMTYWVNQKSRRKTN